MPNRLGGPRFRRAAIWLAALAINGFGMTDAGAVAVQFDADEEVRTVLAATVSVRRVQAVEDPDAVRFWIRRIPREGQTALQSIGYYQARVTARLSDSEQVIVEVETGPATRVASLQIGLGPGFESVPVEFPLQVGDVFNHSRYESGIQTIHAWLLEHGYLAFSLEHREVAVHSAESRADITLEWDAGPQHRFGEVSHVGSPFHGEFMRRYLPFQPGDAFAEASLQVLANRLRNSGYFRSVEISPLVPQDGSLIVPVEVRVEPLDRTIYQLGLSVGSDLGPGVEAEVERRFLNDRGHRVLGTVRWATDQQFAAVRLELPSPDNFDQSIFLNATAVDESTASADRQTVRVGVRRQRRAGDWRRVDSLDLLYEDFLIGGTDEQSRFLTPGLEFSRVNADDPIFPRRGWRSAFKLSGASDSLASSTDFVRAEFNHKRVGALGERSRWILRTRLGALSAKDFDRVPVSQRFLAGGASSVRGFDFESLGPRNEAGEVIGGEYVVEASAELDRHLRGNWGVAVFVDTGNAFGRGSESLEVGAGLGLRWRSPIGPLRFDLAAAMSESGNPVTLHVSAGPDLQ